MHRLRPQLTYANVISTLALFIALGGSSYAAVTLGRNAVKNRHIANNAVTSLKVRDGTLRKGDFARNVLTTPKTGPKGDPGAPGAPGATGPKGDKGATGASGTPALTRAATNGAVAVPANGAVALSNASFNTPAGVIEQFFGDFTGTLTGACTAGQGLTFMVTRDGGLLMSGILTTTGSGQLQPTVAYLFEKGTAAQHALALQVQDTCDGSWTLDLKVDVIGLG